MKPINFEHSNFTFKAPKDMPDCCDLKVFTGHDTEGRACIISKWELDEKDLEDVAKSKAIFLSITGVQQPPVWLSPLSPFEQQEGQPLPSLKDQIIDILTQPDFRGKVQEVLKGYGLQELNDMHAQADIENLIKNEILKSNL